MKHSTISLLLFLSLSMPAWSAIDMPDNIQDAVTVDAEKLIELVQSDEKFVLIDSRITKDREHGYIEGSVSLPDIDTSCNELKQFIPTMKSPALFYCNGVKCGRSVKAIRIALTCGYSNLYWFRGGFDEWEKKGFPVIKE